MAVTPYKHLLLTQLSLFSLHLHCSISLTILHFQTHHTLPFTLTQTPKITVPRPRKGRTLKHPKQHKKKKKKPMTTLFLLLLILQTHLTVSNGSSKLGPKPPRDGEIDTGLKRVCAGRVGECTDMVKDEEFEMMGSDSSEGGNVRKRLVMMEMHRRYISYETLRRDMVPCGIPGASYYNCGAAEANHYNRGCSVITRCRSIKD